MSSSRRGKYGVLNECHIRFTDEEKRSILKLAQHRAAPKLAAGIDRTQLKEDTVKLNARGLAGEIGYARWFAVPFYQNPSSGGDHHRNGDLRLRNGDWFEVKTTAKPLGDLVLRSTDGGKWDWCGSSVWRTKESILTLCGMASPTMARELGEDEERGKERKYTVRVLRGRHLRPTKPLAERTARMKPRPTGDGSGLRCPWCFKVWPCGDLECAAALVRREEICDR
jgi:hypothetical protein